MSKNVVTFKSVSKVTQSHCKLYHSIDCVWFHRERGSAALVSYGKNGNFDPL